MTVKTHHHSFRFRPLALLSAGCLLMLQQAGAEQVVLYSAPDIRAAEVARVSSEAAELQLAEPALDPAKAVLGWQFVEWPQTVRGFVADQDVGKDLDPVAGAMIRKEPREGAETIAAYPSGTPVRIIERGAWWEIELALSLPAYFIPTQAPHDDLAQLEDAGATAPAAPPPSSQPQLFPIEDDVQPQPSVDISRPGPAPIAQSQTQPGIMSQRFEGVFRKSSRGPFGWRRPPQPYYLEDRRGDRLAWIDTSIVVFSGSFDDYIDKEIIVFGELDPDVASASRVIHARNMRLP